MAEIQNTDNKCWRWYGSNRNALLVGLKNGTATLEGSLALFFFFFLAKLNILLPYYPVIMLFGIYPKELKRNLHRKTCTQMFITAWFISAQTWKQPDVFQQVDKKKLVHPDNRLSFSDEKQMKYQVTKKTRRGFNASC